MTMRGREFSVARMMLLAGVLFGMVRSPAWGQLSQTMDQYSVPVSPNRDDVKAIGMGNAQVGMGTRFNAMMYNPALLTHSRVSYEVPGIQAMLPTSTFDAISWRLVQLDVAYAFDHFIGDNAFFAQIRFGW